MSKINNKSAHQLMGKKERTIEDYIELFSGRNIEEEEVTIVTNDRYKRLYNLSKLNKAKAENYRQKIMEQRDIEELAECSFAPKINKEYKYKKVTLIKNKNSIMNKSKTREKREGITDVIILDLLKRQDEWLKKKNKKIEINTLNAKKKIKKELIFAPEINRKNQKLINDMKIGTQEIVVDPESYQEFIDRNKKNVRNFSIKKNNNQDFKKIKNFLNNNKYDYTEHKLLNKNIIKKYSFSKSKSKNKQSKSVGEKNNIIIKNIPISKSKMSNIKNVDIYSMIYFDSKEKFENRINEGFSEKEKKNILNGKTQIEFKEALDIVHKLMINLNIIDDNDDDINNDKI